MAIIDFSKIKAKDLPTKKETLNICGTMFDVTIYPMTGKARMEYWALDYQDEADERVRKRVILALEHGAKLSMEEILKLIDIDWDEAVNLSGKIFALTKEYENQLDDLKAAAEKNFQKDSGTDTQV